MLVYIFIGSVCSCVVSWMGKSFAKGRDEKHQDEKKLEVSFGQNLRTQLQILSSWHVHTKHTTMHNTWRFDSIWSCNIWVIAMEEHFFSLKKCPPSGRWHISKVADIEVLLLTHVRCDSKGRRNWIRMMGRGRSRHIQSSSAFLAVNGSYYRFISIDRTIAGMVSTLATKRTWTRAVFGSDALLRRSSSHSMFFVGSMDRRDWRRKKFTASSSHSPFNRSVSHPTPQEGCVCLLCEPLKSRGGSKDRSMYAMCIRGEWLMWRSGVCEEAETKEQQNFEELCANWRSLSAPIWPAIGQGKLSIVGKISALHRLCFWHTETDYNA